MLLPAYASWGLAEPIKAKNPLIILADRPEEVFKAGKLYVAINFGLVCAIH